MLARIEIALCRAGVVVERNAWGNDVNQREPAVRKGRFEDRYKLLFIAGKTARHERRAQAQGQHDGIDGRKLIGFAALALRSDIRRSGKLPLCKSVDTV